MKRAIALIFCTLCAIVAVSAPVDTSITRRVASNFRVARTCRPDNVRESAAHLIYTGKHNADNLRHDSIDCYRVYGWSNGFVIVSADDRIEPVLGYSLESAFDPDHLPEALVEMLREYARAIVYANDNNTISPVEIQTQWRQLSTIQNASNRHGTPVIGPLLSTRWNQNAPYNNLCPSDVAGPGGHAYAGCVATAMAQIIRYWRYPEHGVGSHSYTANYADAGYGNYGVQNVNFSNATYDYTNMPNTINSNSTASEINAVATLTYHCGVSVNMQYGNNGSGAVTSYAANSLNTYFGYMGCVYKTRSNYNDANWVDLLKSNLDNMQPVLYNGRGTTGGHAFVCDGYDSENYFHFNWGWGGNNNGYFLISSLNPGIHNFNTNHGAVVNIRGNCPMLFFERKNLSFLTSHGTTSEVKKVSIRANVLSLPITITVTGNFKISTDSITFTSDANLANSGGIIYIQYQPTDSAHTDYGHVYISSGDLYDTLFLTGNTYDNGCVAPQNLMISSSNLSLINLSWDSPTIDRTPKSLTWCTEVPVLNSGFDTDYKVTMLQRFSDTDLVAYHGLSLTQISFYARNNTTAYKIIVYKGGTYTSNDIHPGRLVYEQDLMLSDLNLDNWNSIPLNIPVTIDASEEMWFGVCVEAPGNTYVLPLGNCAQPSKGAIFGLHNENNISWIEYSPNYSCLVGGTIENRRQISNYSVYRDDQFIGNVNNTTHLDYLQTTDTRLYTVIANWSHGCSASAQKSFLNVAQIEALPGALDFYTNHGIHNDLKEIRVAGSGLSAPITVAVVGDFQISVDSIDFGQQVVLPSAGGKIIVKYTPPTSETIWKTGLIHLNSGAYSCKVYLSGQSSSGCNPPRNLTIARTGDNINLSWNEAEPTESTTTTLSWFNNSSIYNIGYSSFDYKCYMMQRYEATDLISYHGQQLTAISFMPVYGVTTYKLVIYEGGYYSGNSFNQGTLILEQDIDINTLNFNVWNKISLNSPIVIQADNELWYGIYLEAPAGIYAMVMGDNNVSGKGALVRLIDPFTESWSEYSDMTCVVSATIEKPELHLLYYDIYKNLTPVGATLGTVFSDSLYYNGNYEYSVWAVWNDGCMAAIRNNITALDLCDYTGSNYYISTCEPYEWNSELYNHSGTYWYSYQDENGCKQVDSLFLTVNYSAATEIVDSACDTYIWNDETYTQSGTYTRTFQTAEGCDSVVTLLLTVNYSASTEIVDSACDTYTWNDETYTQSGSYTQTFQTAEGCDSVVTLFLTVNYSASTEIVDSACDTYTWNDETYTQSGTYTQRFQTAEGCDSVVTLILTISESSHTAYTFDVCKGETFAYGAFAIDTDTLTEGPCQYEYYTTNAAGCDSVITFTIYVRPTYRTEISDSVIIDHEYHDNGFNILENNEAGIFEYTQSLMSVYGCDSVVALTLIVYNGSGLGNISMKNSIRLYPNPANDFFIIETDTDVVLQKVELFNIAGQLVQEIGNIGGSQIKMGIDKLSDGIYIVSITTDRGRTVKRVTIKQ